MPFNINDFQANLKDGFAFTDHFECEVHSPYGLDRDMHFKVISTNLPGKSAQTTDYKFHGPLRKVPYSYINNELTLTVLCSPDYRERDYFLEWLDLAVGDTRVNDKWFAGAYKKVSYYNEYIGRILIKNYDKMGRKVRETTFEECFPLNVNEIQLSWADSAIGQFTVGLQYYAFHERKVSVEPGSKTSPVLETT